MREKCAKKGQVYFMKRWGRALYQPCLPLGENGCRVTGCAKHIQLSREAATEGMVLLKNEENMLPLAPATRVALFGKASVDYVRGGGGSGEVTVAYERSLQEGFEIKEKEGKVQVLASLGEFYRKNVKEQFAKGVEPGFTVEPEIPEELVKDASSWADVAVISICRFSGEGWDRKGIPGDGDFYLTKEEQKMVDTVTANFKNAVVVLNVGGMVDTSWFKDHPVIKSVLLAWQGGIEGGLAAADLLCGDANPSAKLTDTFAGSFDDYPSSANFNESEDYVEYTEDIYVGYRYFETIPGAAEKVNYPFGFGLSYTTFDIEPLAAKVKDGVVTVSVLVTNTGKRDGKEVIQLYYSAPQGKLGKPKKELVAYQKTRMLRPGDVQKIYLEFPVANMASYDDLGKVAKSAYVLEKGEYVFMVGNSVRNVQTLKETYQLEEDVIVEQLSEKCPPLQLKKRMLADGSYEALEQRENYHPVNVMKDMKVSALEGITSTQSDENREEFKPEYLLIDVAEGKVDLDTFVAQLSDRQLAELLGGQPNTGVANTYGMGNIPEYGVPNIMTADGPAGLRIDPQCGICTTAFPCSTMVACSWNTELAEQIGAAAAWEVKENNIGIWLTPAMNIHRSPLCGRNFEYYSEDPLITGKTGAAMIRGIQSRRIGASMKHFCANNKETNRSYSDSRVSERALREIYLKGFEIAVKEAQPWTIMTSYNLMNGTRPCYNKELLTDILRGEWGFEGMVNTDWWNHAEHYLEVKAGNDMKMAWGYPERLLEAMKLGELTREEMCISAKRVLQMILKQD